MQKISLESIRHGRMARTAPLVGITVRTAGESIVEALRRRKASDHDAAGFHERAANRYADYLGNSKGVLMKAGQILSFATNGTSQTNGTIAIYQRALAQLQDRAPAVPFSTAVATIEREFGKSIDQIFSSIDPVPIGAASIGQVHAATLLNGQRVAVKIQYPGVDAAIRSDLENAGLLAALLDVAKSKVPGLMNTDVNELARELGDRIRDEVDYNIEVQNQSKFASQYRGHPFVKIPEVFPEYSTRRVLTQELATGLRWSEAVEAEPELRSKWGEVIYRFAIGSVRRFGLFNADPHPGNYMFNSDGSVTFLDFGCVKQYSEEQIRTMRIVMNASVEGDASALLNGLREGGAIDSHTEVSADEALRWFRAGIESLTATQPYTFTPESVERSVEEKFSPNGPFGAVIRELTMPPEMLMMMRLEVGVYAILSGLRATGMWEAIRREWDCASGPGSVMGAQDLDFWSSKK